MAGFDSNDIPARSATLKYVRDLKNPSGASKLKQGEQQLYSFYAPSLEAGEYTIAATQKIDAFPSEGPEEGNTKTLTTSQKFTVVAPRFTLPAGSIHSMYPAPGRTEPAKTLPHVVLNDPHLPWERDALGEKGIDVEQNQVPWLAVLVFTQEELRLDEKHLKRDSGIFPNTVAIAASSAPAASTPDVTQNKTLAINMKIRDLLAVESTTTPISNLSLTEVEKSLTTDVIFLQSKLFSSLVTTYDEKGKPVNVPGTPTGQLKQKLADVSRYKFLAHARQVSTKGMTVDNAKGEAFFSVVISHRVGPLDLTQPTPVVVHLVSIEGVGKMALPITTEYVALSSLHSWTYSCLPAHSMDILHSFQHLGRTLGLLRPSDEIIGKLVNCERARQRLTDGYSLVRYITQTGEETVAFTRGPLTPTIVKYPMRPDWGVSTFGTDLQILDTTLGVMDITYSSAWQLGKSLALADHPFAAALSRVKAHILDEAMSRSKVAALIKRSPSMYKTRAEALQSLLATTVDLYKLLDGERTAGRFFQPPPPIAPDDYSHGSDLINQTFDWHCSDAAKKLSRATDDSIYNEHNTPCSTDWMVVFSWILDRMYLVNVPAHYMISDPTHLPPESLRFFNVDANWVDAMIDGGLSIANHMQCYDGKIRTVIKRMVNSYLETPHDNLELCPQIPNYGFLLRSDICSQFPDLVVEAPMPDNQLGAPILYHKNLDKGVMLCLFDRVPSKPDFETLTFTQPPHQQCFSAGDSLDESTFQMIYKQPHTSGVSSGGGGDSHTWRRSDIGESVEQGPVFLWGDEGSNIRTLLFPALADAILKKGGTSDKYAGSALVGNQLGSAFYKLQIDLEKLMTPDPPKTDSGQFVLDSLALADEPVEQPEAERLSLSPSPPPSSTCCCILTSPRFVALVPQPTSKIYPQWASVPRFSYKVFSVQSQKQELLMADFEQDLVFSIMLERAGGKQMRLQKIVLDIPIGPVDRTRPKLMETYDGSVKMLGNLRFNVLAQFRDGKVSLTLLPRTQSGSVLITHIDEISFLMSGVNVNEYPNPQKMVEISVKETYWKWKRVEGEDFKVPLVRSP